MGNRTAVTVKDNKQRLVEQRNYAYNESNQIVTESIKSGYHPDYELIEYINDVNREYTEVLVEKDYRGRTDTSHIYGADRLSFDHRNGYTGYYLYDPRGSVTGITTEWGDIYQSYCYDVFGNITYGTPEYENEYTYNGESYNPNIKSQYLRARYYDVVTASFLTEDSYLGNINEPLTLNRYSYCIGNPENYADPSGHMVTAGVGAVVGGIVGLVAGTVGEVVKAVEAKGNGQEYDWTRGAFNVLNSTVSGVVGGAVAGATLNPALAGAAAGLIGGAAGGAVGAAVAPISYTARSVLQMTAIEVAQSVSSTAAGTVAYGVTQRALNGIETTPDDVERELVQGIQFGLLGYGVNTAVNAGVNRWNNSRTNTAIRNSQSQALKNAQTEGCENKSGSTSRYDRTGYQSNGRSNNLFGRDRSTRRTTNLTEWRRSIGKQDIHNEMRLFLGDDYVKVDSGKWRSLDGTRQFRVKPDDYLGNHGIGQPTVPNTPHVHFEFLTPRSNGNGFDVKKIFMYLLSDWRMEL